MTEEDKPPANLNAEAGGDLNVGGSIIGGDQIQNTTINTTVQDGSTITRYAVIGLVIVAVLAIAGMAYALGVRPPESATATPAVTQTLFALAPATATPTPTLTAIATLAATASSTPSPTATATNTATPTATPVFAADCLPAGSSGWTYYPPNPRFEPVAGCWKLDDFLPRADGLSIQRVTVANSGEQQRGLYLRLGSQVDLAFTVRVDQFRAPAGGASTFTPNLAFGVTEAGSRFTYNGIYLYYYALETGTFSTRLQVIRENGGVAYSSALDLAQEQRVRFSLSDNTLRLYVDDLEQPVATFTLRATPRAFYLGYRLGSNAELNATLSNFTLTQRP
jgi:hypothetical protein